MPLFKPSNEDVPIQQSPAAKTTCLLCEKHFLSGRVGLINIQERVIQGELPQQLYKVLFEFESCVLFLEHVLGHTQIAVCVCKDKTLEPKAFICLTCFRAFLEQVRGRNDQQNTDESTSNSSSDP